MLDITRSQANQQTVDGVDGEWVVTLDGEELYTLPAYITPPDVFTIRDVVEKMMKLARKEGRDSRQAEIDGILKNGQQQLDALRDENVRLATALEQHILSDEVA